MQSKNYYNVKVIKPINDEVMKLRYNEAIFKIIKNRVSRSLTIETIIKKLESDRSDHDENSSNL